MVGGGGGVERAATSSSGQRDTKGLTSALQARPLDFAPQSHVNRSVTNTPPTVVPTTTGQENCYATVGGQAGNGRLHPFKLVSEKQYIASYPILVVGPSSSRARMGLNSRNTLVHPYTLTNTSHHHSWITMGSVHGTGNVRCSNGVALEQWRVVRTRPRTHHAGTAHLAQHAILDPGSIRA